MENKEETGVGKFTWTWRMLNNISLSLDKNLSTIQKVICELNRSIACVRFVGFEPASYTKINQLQPSEKSFQLLLCRASQCFFKFKIKKLCWTIFYSNIQNWKIVLDLAKFLREVIYTYFRLEAWSELRPSGQCAEYKQQKVFGRGNTLPKAAKMF